MSDDKRRGSADDHSTVDELITALRSDGEEDSRGTFTMDRALARTKMRQFQLQNPSHYVLSLVHAAVLKNATRIDVRIDDDDLEMSFDGRPFALKDLEDLYGALFTRALGRDVEALRELAIAINAASALDTKFFRLRSGDGTRAVRYELDDENAEAYDYDLEHIEGTHIHVKTRFKGRLARALDFLGGEHPLSRALRVCCQFSWLPIWVNGNRVSRGLRTPNALGNVHFETPNLRGVAGFLPDAQQNGEVALCKYGVWFSTVLLPDARPGFFAVVEGFRLRKDISQTRAVNDDALAEVLGEVGKAAESAMDALCQEAIGQQSQPDLPAQWTRRVLRGELLQHTSPEALFGPSVSQRVKNLTRLPLWAVHATTDETARRKSLQDLWAFRGAGGTVGLVQPGEGEGVSGLRIQPLVGESRLLLVVARQVEERSFLRTVLTHPTQPS